MATALQRRGFRIFRQRAKSRADHTTLAAILFCFDAPSPLRQGAEIEYRLRVHGIPVRWRTRITAWDPPRGFVDEQVRGPYRLWIHEHRFSDDSGGTLCEDYVKYAPPGGALVNKLFVERDIRKIFAYRSERLRAIFGDDPLN